MEHLDLTIRKGQRETTLCKATWKDYKYVVSYTRNESETHIQYYKTFEKAWNDFTRYTEDIML